jgi:general secretion pathway protein F
MGNVSMLELDALDKQDAMAQAAGQGFVVLSVKSKRNFYPLLSATRSKFPLVLFSQELLSLLNAGLSLIEALEALTEKEHHGEIKQTLEKIVSRLYEGQPLSVAVQEFPEIFPPLYVATLQASEKTGGISEALTRYVAYQSQIDLVRKKIINASIYPVLLMVVGGLVVLFLMGYVVPKFAVVYESVHGNLPWLSRLLLSWGELLHTHGVEVLVMAMALLLMAVYGLTRQSVRETLLGKLWNIPALGERMHIYQLARFYRTLGMLLKGGIPVVNALDMVTGLLQPSLQGRLAQAQQSLREGKSISIAMETQNLTTPVALRMLRVGERAGNMGEMMDRIASFYDEEMARWVEWFTRLFEPILMALIGLVIGTIVILMYLPIFELAGSLQ